MYFDKLCLSLCLIVIVNLSNFSFSLITIETTKSAEPLVSSREIQKFSPESYVSCVCVEGVYAFRVIDVGVNRHRDWRILGADRKECFRFGDWVSEVRRITRSGLLRPRIHKLGPSNTFAVVGKQDWKVSVPIPDNTIDSEKEYCLVGAPDSNSYCIYNVQVTDDDLRESQFKPDCSTRATLLKPVECRSYSPPAGLNEELEDAQVCSLIPPRRLPSRFKRDAGAPNDTDFLEEDLLAVEMTEEEKAKIKGNETMMAALASYVKNQVKVLLIESDPDNKMPRKMDNKKYPPAQTLLRLAADVAKRICTPISEDTFSMVVNAFLGQQNRNYLKDSYISFPAYERVLESMQSCEMEAQALMFLPNETDGGGYCASQLPRKTSGAFKRRGGNDSLPTLPKYAVAEPDVFEPVVEVMWKTFLMAHSYCFKYFHRFFNDHHTFTTTLIPFFTNKIQELWIIAPPGGAPPADAAAAKELNYTSDSIWYGDLLGNAGDLFQDVDRCYQASRKVVGSKIPDSYVYPWFMRRPLRDPGNEWVQKAPPP